MHIALSALLVWNHDLMSALARYKAFGGHSISPEPSQCDNYSLGVPGGAVIGGT